jgi:prophage regulatory protein
MKQAIVQIAPMFLARANAAAYLSISESMLDTLVARGEAPKPRKLSAGRSAWLVDDLVTWGKARPISDLLPPANSGYGKAGKPV